ncbi:ABC transporter ATP-binding protein [Marinilactibacillus sp. Marseille-P9653]|uniref:ABC transporter ATP-binding protein n=1 Tax=Marinilactibacillus sp. Marseille-P9653 TaxID=2866583 RepID=UPI001CE419FB|nr:ABC transporter ATP-binding protein [Marinilactibacillus sp. Marseille-P9653]
MARIKCENLTIQYPFRKKPAIEDFSAVFSSGKRTLLIGPSGAGKSSLILALNGLIPQSIEASVTGKILVGEIDPQASAQGSLSKQVAILFQDPETQFCMVTVEEEVAFGLENLSYSKIEMDKVIESSLKKVGLFDRRKEAIYSLSGGMKQKLAFACLMAIDPDVLILDEPTANLDPQSSRDLIKLLNEWSKDTGKTLIVIEHQVEDVLPIIDEVIALDKEGYKIVQGSPREVFQQQGKILMKEGIFLPYASTLALKTGENWNPFPLTGIELKGQIEASSPPLPIVLNEKKETLLKVSNLTFHYPEQASLFNDLSFSVEKGSIVAIVGENGAGKSTLAKLMVRALTPEAGSISFKQKNLQDYSDTEFLQEVSLVFQRPELQFIAESVAAEMAFGPSLLQLENWETETDVLLEEFGLAKLKKAHPYTLSQGQKRRLSVAIMLANGQKCLILDEPTFGQDAANTKALMAQLVKKQQEGFTFIMITHDMDLVERYASKVIVLDEGKCLYQGSPQALFHTPSNHSIVSQANLIVPEQLSLERLVNESRGKQYA